MIVGNKNFLVQDVELGHVQVNTTYYQEDILKVHLWYISVEIAMMKLKK